MKKVLFFLKRIYLRFGASYPKHLDDNGMFKLGKFLWTNFTPTEDMKESAEKFQRYALSLKHWEIYSLQEYLRYHLRDLEKNFSEHTVGREEDYERKYRETVRLHLHAIC